MILAKTKRLIIRTWTTDDIAPYAKIIADPDVMKFIGTGQVRTAQEAEAYINKCMDNISKTGWARFAVADKKTEELLGFCGYSNYNNELDFGWRYAKKHWNKGYGTEAAQAVLDLGIHTFKFPRIVCISYPENRGSIRIIEKIGMQFEKDIMLNGNSVRQYVKLNEQNKI